MGVARRSFQNIGGSNIKLYFHGMKLHFTDLNSFADHFSLSRGLQRVAMLIIVGNFSRTGSAWRLAQTNDDEDNWPIYLTHYHPMSTLEVAGDNRPECRHSPLD